MPEILSLEAGQSGIWDGRYQLSSAYIPLQVTCFGAISTENQADIRGRQRCNIGNIEKILPTDPVAITKSGQVFSVFDRKASHKFGVNYKALAKKECTSFYFLIRPCIEMINFRMMAVRELKDHTNRLRRTPIYS